MQFSKIFLSPVFIFFFVTGLGAQNVDHWESIIKTGDSVKYSVPDSEPDADWKNLAYNDSEWAEGRSGIGYGDGDDSTVIAKCISVYIRYKFSIPDTSVIGALLLDMDYDDAFVAYLNGTEVARANMGESFAPTSFDQPADGYSEAKLYNGELPMRFPINRSVLETLVEGDNIFTIEVHNENAGSSDLSSNAFLHVGIGDSGTYFQSLPDWFYKPLRFSSTLPILTIDTEGGQILDDPEIVAKMGVIDNGPGMLNHPDDSLNHYNGNISIEIRGSSSMMFPKKSYSIETQNDDGSNNNVPLLGMPTENDWVLHAPYSDKALLRNVISYAVFERMGHWAPRTRFVDLYLNEDYQGVYVLTEKIKRDKNRVDIAKITEADVSDLDISGGYILQFDRINDLQPDEYWTSPVRPVIEGEYMHFEYSDPDSDELTPAQTDYIQNWINDLDALMSGESYTDPISGYRAYMDIRSFVDYILLQEFNKDIDAYRLSAFFYKTNDRDGGLLHAGSPWDYNLTLGNSDYGVDVHETYNWLYTRLITPYWWRRLMDDPWFVNEVYCRWEDLSANLLSEDGIFDIMDSSIQVIDSSIDYNFERWPILGEYVWPNYYVAESHEEEIDFVKNWVSERLVWLDEQWGGLCVITSDEQNIIQPALGMVITPNPSDLTHSRIQFGTPLSGEYKLSLFDMNGRQVYQHVYRALPGSRDIDLEDLSYLNDGVYLMNVSGEDGFSGYLKLVKN